MLKLQALLPCRSSVRRFVSSTNFKEHYEFSLLAVYDRGFRLVLEEWGVLSGRKCTRVTPPAHPYSELDYLRGLMDGDGSLGFTAASRPFLSFVTASDAMALYVIDFLARVCGRPAQPLSRNSRDGLYNIITTGVRAQVAVTAIYYPDCLALDRKIALAQRVAATALPRRWSAWLPADDAYVVSHDVADAAAALSRTRRAVMWRRAKLRRTAEQ